LAHYVAEVLSHAVPPGVWQPLREEDLPVLREPATLDERNGRAS
jgi:hypothetical protein